MAERRCDNCDFSRRLGPDINCWESPPQPLFLGVNPATNQRIVVPMLRPTWPDYHCQRWQEMQPEHPDYSKARIEAASATHDGPEMPQ